MKNAQKLSEANVASSRSAAEPFLQTLQLGVAEQGQPAMFEPTNGQRRIVGMEHLPSGDRRVGGVQRGPGVRITFDGQGLLALEGETVAAALLAVDRREWRQTSRRGEPRGLFCNMGVCFDCVMQIDGRANLRACQTVVRDGMRVETQHGEGSWDPLS